MWCVVKKKCVVCGVASRGIECLCVCVCVFLKDVCVWGGYVGIDNDQPRKGMVWFCVVWPFCNDV